MSDMDADVESVEAEHGEKMIEIKVRFWTDKIAPSGQIVPKHAHTSGVVRIQRNETHGIEPSKPRPFNSLLEIGSAIEDVLLEHGIKLHLSRKDTKYIV